jgi:integrase
VPFFGVMDIARISRHDCERWVASLTDAPGSIATYRTTLAGIFKAMIRDGYRTLNPLDGVKLPNGETAPYEALTGAEVAALIEALPGHLRALAAVQAGLGLRQGEACALTWGKVDLKAGKVTIDRQVDVGRVDAPLKTKASYRTLSLPPWVRARLETHRDEFGAGNVHGLVFVTLNGTPIGRQTWASTFRSAAKRAGVDATSHDLRHYCASRLIADGVSPAAVAKFLGHKTAATTLSVYSHWFSGDDDRILAALEAEPG